MLFLGCTGVRGTQALSDHEIDYEIDMTTGSIIMTITTYYVVLFHRCSAVDRYGLGVGHLQPISVKASVSV